MPKITEQQIGEAVLQILATCDGGAATIAHLTERIPHHVNLSEEDCKQSDTRPNEQVWEQQVRNLISHRGTAGNIVAEGLATYAPGTLTITDAGRLHVAHKSP